MVDVMGPELQFWIGFAYGFIAASCAFMGISLYMLWRDYLRSKNQGSV